MYLMIDVIVAELKNSSSSKRISMRDRDESAAAVTPDAVEATAISMLVETASA